MDLDEILKKIFKNMDNVIGVLIFVFALLGPLLKKMLEKKRQQGRMPGREQGESEREWTFDTEEEEQETFPPMDRPIERPIERPPVISVEERTPPEVLLHSEPSLAQRRQFSNSIEEEVADIVEGKRNVAAEADAIASIQEMEVSDLSEAAPAMELLEDEDSTIHSGSFERLSPLEMAIALGGTLDRPIALQGPNQRLAG